MKRLITFFLLLTTSLLLSQNEYGYLVETKITGALHANNGEMAISTNLGSLKTLNYFANSSTLGNTYYDFIALPNNFSTASIRVNNYAIAIASFPDCDYTDQYDTTKQDFGDPYILFNGCSFNQRVYSLHIFEEADKLLNGVCTNDTLTLNFGYEWQFSLDGINWIDFPAAYNKKAITSFVFKDLLTASGIDTNTLSASQVRFRTGYNNNFTNIITYQLVPCAPELVGEIVTQNTKCNYTSDGKFTMTVDRDLVLGEKLIVSLYQLNQASSSYIFLTQEATDTLIDNSNQTYSYSWVGDIPSGNYKIKYQILKGAGNAIPSNDPSWTTIGFSNEFSISNPNKFIFNVVKLNDESCFERGDGKVRVSVTSFEPGRTFQYRLYKVLESTVTVFQDWTDFSNDTFEVGGLDKSIYRIKVRDNKECYAK